MSEDIFLSLIVPAYNEEQNIPFTFSQITEYFAEKDFAYEVIMIDDGSTDATVERAQEFNGEINNFTIIRSTPNRGKGYVLRKAMLEARGKYIAFMDADSSVLVNELDNFLSLLKENFDIYIASRRVQGAVVFAPLKRKVLGNIYVYLAKILLGIKVSDVNCGFKMFTTASAKKIFSRQVMNDWSYDVESLFLAKRYGYSVKEVPVYWVYKSTSKVKPFRDSIKSFISLLRIKGNVLSSKYSLQ